MSRLFLSIEFEIEDGNARTGIGDGSGCTWRLVAQPKTVNDTGCMAARMLAPLLAHNKACFGSLPQQPPDPAGAGFGSCFTQAIMGGAGIDPIAPVSRRRRRRRCCCLPRQLWLLLRHPCARPCVLRICSSPRGRRPSPPTIPAKEAAPTCSSPRVLSIHPT
eukprot:COSAG01_NODE_8503_length_2761_cov_2.343351_4_plen_162_part_00